MGNALALVLGNSVGHAGISAKGLIGTVPNRSSKAMALIFPHRIGQALSVRYTLACTAGMGNAGPKGPAYRFPNRMADTFAHRI